MLSLGEAKGTISKSPSCAVTHYRSCFNPAFAETKNTLLTTVGYGLLGINFERSKAPLNLKIKQYDKRFNLPGNARIAP